MSAKNINLTNEAIYLNNGTSSRVLKNGQQNTFKAKVGEHYRIIKRKAGKDELVDNVIAKRVGDDLLLQYEDDTKVTLENYYKECKVALECDLTLPSKDGGVYSVSGENVTGAPIGDGSTLVYAHGNHDILMGMAKGNSLIEGILSEIEGLQLTYIPTESMLDRIAALGYWGLGGLAAVAAAGAGIGAALSGGGSNNDAPPKDTTASPVRIEIVDDLIIDGHVTAGPMFAGVTLFAYDNAGHLLGKSIIDANGYYKIIVIDGSNYTGAILVKAVDSNSINSNYLDEVSGSNKSLNTELRAFSVAGPSNTTSYAHPDNSDATLEVNISIVSELAVRHAGVTTDAAPTSMAVVTNANAGVASALGLNGIDVVGNAATTTNSVDFNGIDGLSASEKIGLVLAKLSGLDSLNGGNISTSLDALNQGLQGSGVSLVLDASATALYDQGRQQALNALKNAPASAEQTFLTDSPLNRQLLGDVVITEQSLITNGFLLVTGTALPNTEIEVTLPDGTIQTVNVNSSGVFTFTSGKSQTPADLECNPTTIQSQDALGQQVNHTSANTLTLTAKDVNDMADFNSIHLTTVSDDGKIWTNVIGTALSATTQFHQVVVEGTSADKLNLSLGFSSAGTVSNGSTTYNVYQNTATNSQVITDSAITNVVIPPDPLNATACAAVFTSSSTGWNGLTGQVAVAINSPAFANATIKLYVNSTLVQTATMSASGSYNGQSLGLSPSRLTVNNNDIVHGEFVVNGVTYVIGGGMKYLNPTSAGNGSGTQVAVTYATPLVLDLNGDGVQTVGLNESVQFDLTDSGTPQKTSWVDKQDGLLAIDLNGDGQINSGAELFGNHTQLANGTTASNGWAALGAMDSNHDGKIEAHDANFDKLRVWVDANGDGVTDAGELHTLAEVNVASINLNADNTITYQNGNALQGFSSFTSTDGTTHDIVDVSFLVQPVLADVGLQVQNAMSNVFTLSMGESLDLSGLGNATQESGINMSTDSAANSVKLTLTDVLNTAVTNGLHQLTLTGDANDSVQLTAHEWTNTGTTVTEGDHSYAVYNATTSIEAQLLIDQAMVNAGHVM